jgi:hypothetical protein
MCAKLKQLDNAQLRELGRLAYPMLRSAASRLPPHLLG